MKITSEYLRLNNACAQQLELFEQTFPLGTEITRSSCSRATRIGLDTHWLARELFSAGVVAAYSRKYDELVSCFQKACVPSNEAYKDRCAQDYTRYHKACATSDIVKAGKQYERDCRKTTAEKTRVQKPLIKALYKQLGQLFYSTCKENGYAD